MWKIMIKTNYFVSLICMKQNFWMNIIYNLYDGHMGYGDQAP